ncbi:hypothetical protein [Roseibacillus ishigakijimensis]|uniref:Uncharacterized protein n=1 Tax=Roseibacillus ishigakijimensis TaxID=454146 RepID=A0A934VMR8_9BACT|nr:hypothetical protein [Roseibacillus ishigakijimensis]MBK1834245.1 hypothetical protein [Roseibacillus ishigakijimensis]
MKNDNLLTSPTPWLATGMGLVVGLVCLLLGAGDSFGDWLRGGFEARGFPALREVSPASPWSLLALVVVTSAVVLAVEGTPGLGRRLLLLLSSLVLAAMACPVLALWSWWWNPLVQLVALFWAGLAALLHAASREREASKPMGEVNL